MFLLIEDLELEAVIGILPFERERAQKIIINADLEYNYQGTYLNYVEIVEFLSSELKANQYGLLEEALQDLSQKLKTCFPTLNHISLSLKKPDILSNCIVGARINL